MSPSRRGALASAALLLALALVGGLFALAYRFDNKYTAPLATGGVQGAQPLDAAALQAGELAVLAGGWELYDRLYTPQELADGRGGAPEQTYIGQYPDFSRRQAGRSPYGAATYRLVLTGAQSLPALSLQVQEVFSASRIWVDGVLLWQQGRPEAEGYRPGVQNALLTFSPGARTEIVVEAANYSHYYGGLYYPPLLGTPEALSSALAGQLLFYGAISLGAVTLALFSLAVWAVDRRERHYLSFGGFCLLFGLHAAYPLFHWLGGLGGRWPYVLEDAAFFGAAFCLCFLVSRLSHLETSRAQRWLAEPLTLFFALFSAVCNAFVLPRAPGFLPLYGALVDLCRLGVGSYLIITSFRGVRKQRSSGWLVYLGCCCYGVALWLSAVQANRFEPIRGGWPVEYGGLGLVVLLAAAMVRENVRIARQNRALTAHLEETVAQRTRQLTELQNQRRRFLADLAHDIKGPAAAIATYVSLIRQGEGGDDRELGEYLDIIGQKSGEVAQRLGYLQRYTAQELTSGGRQRVELAPFLQRLHRSLLPDTDASAIHFTLAPPPEGVSVLAFPDRLTRALENLVYNAIDFTPAEGEIALRAGVRGKSAWIAVSDSGQGVEGDDLPRLFERHFSTRQDKDSRGLGLFIAREALLEMGGDLTASSRPGKGATFTLTLPLWQPPE
ncbi:ATP-binding protein [Oscillospiraceae bacterium 52-8]